MVMNNGLKHLYYNKISEDMKGSSNLTAFLPQLLNNPIVTEDSIKNFISKTYTSGLEINIGDIILYAITNERTDKTYPDVEIKTYNLISLSVSEIELYDIVEESKSHPVVKLKK